MRIKVLLYLLVIISLLFSGRFDSEGFSLKAYCFKVEACEKMYGVLANGDSIVIKLRNVDCPEPWQPYGDSAIAFVKQECEGKEIFVHYDGEYYDVTGTHHTLRTFLILKGYAWIVNDQAPGVWLLEEAGDFAKKEKIGLWSLPNPIAPWVWREMNLWERIVHLAKVEVWKKNENK